MRASRFLRQRAQMNRTRYAMRALVSEVLPSLVDSMQTMNDTLRIQGRLAARAVGGEEQQPEVPAVSSPMTHKPNGRESTDA